jgi:long-chain fatty acid transport protein
MKKSAVLISGLFLLMNSAFAGGILTKTNQSAQFTRMVSRNASTDLDAVYYNPAGIGQLENGFYFALNNQSLFQTYTVNSEFPYLNNPEYKGEMSAPFFPTAFAAYKKDKWSVSLGFGPNAGGGSITYDTGLPTFEKPISLLPISLSAQGLPTTAYSADLSLEGSSVYWGTQLNGTYSINKVLTVALGLRMNRAVNTYNGYIKDIMINPVNPTGGNFGWDGSMRTASSVFTTLSNASKGAAALMQPVINGGGGGFTLSQLQQAGYITAQQAAILAGGLGAAYNPAMTASQVQGAYVAKADGLAGRAAATSDKYIDVEQTGLGLTPIIGVNLHFEKLNIGLKYEYKSFLGLTNHTTQDFTGFFPDSAKTSGDMPAIIAGGADYQIFKKLKLSGSFTYFLDNKIGWGNNVYGQERTIDKNYLELAFGAEYKLTDQFTISAGYLNSNAGVSEQYLSDYSYVNDANGVGAGFQWNLSKRLTLDAGAMVIVYKDQVKNFDASFDPLAASMGPLYKSYKETYGKEAFSFAFGIAYKIF